MYYAGYNSPLGQIIIVGNDNGVAYLDFSDALKIDKAWVKNDSFFNDVILQLDDYFARKLTDFTFKTQVIGTDFQRQVYKYIMQIPYGKVASYTDIAKKLGDEKKVRAVANACGQNKNLIVMPCHRVIKKDGTVGGYTAGLDKKLFLMDLEEIKL